ncbi:hypothetical protein KW805_02895 [Candidatus Pacearchaeota archaeon]|nr:hypothetical protein [Candidatus Pacearchaeota archaeon]
MEDLQRLFARASKINEDTKGYFTSEKLASMRKFDGPKRFKRKALGLCGSDAVKSLDEMAQLLYETGIASSQEEGREITPSLVGKKVYYDSNNDYLTFESVQSTTGAKAYRIFIASRYSGFE